MTFDLVLAGGSVVDGTGAPAFAADVGISGGRIEAVGPLDGAPARERVELDGATVAPGFIDLHTHADLAPFLGEEHDDLQLAPLRQGVTTAICGNCGFSVFPAPPARRPDLLRYLQTALGARTQVFEDLDAFASALAERPLVTNLATLVGHGTLRAGATGFDRRAPEAAERRAIKSALERAFADGAVGLSSGLIYPPGSYASTEELADAARVAARHGRPYVSHIRDEMDHVDEAIDEALRIGAETGAAVQISHHKTAGRRNWGRTVETLERLEDARAEGVDIRIDVYPYTAGSTNLPALLPPWVGDGGLDELLRRLRDPEVREQIRNDFASGIDGWQQLVEPDGWGSVQVASAPRHPEAEGRVIADLGGDPVDIVSELLLGEDGQVTVVVAMMAEEDVTRVVASPLSMIGSDGIPLPGKPHPRWAGTFARVIGKYVRRDRVLTLEQAVHKMTQAPAERFGLHGRGVLRPAAVADVVVFDSAAFEDRATYEEPLEAPAGVRHVLVGGVFGIRDGIVTGARTGSLIRA